ncbi:MAG: polysaccharide lyase, partial [Terriglobia bacterium]
YVYLKTPEPGGTADGIQRKIMWVQDIRGTANYSFFITSDAANGVIPLRFSTNGNVQVPAFSFWNIGTLNYNQWYCLELEVQLNTPGSSDGAVRFWVNGTQVLNQTGVNIRGSFTTGAGVISFGRQADRTNYNPVNEYRYWNDMVISTSYVGP